MMMMIGKSSDGHVTSIKRVRVTIIILNGRFFLEEHLIMRCKQMGFGIYADCVE